MALKKQKITCTAVFCRKNGIGESIGITDPMMIFCY